MDTNQQKVAIYARVSSQEQAEEGVSLEAQIAALNAYAKSQKWEVVDEYIDGGFSGGTDDRPALKRLLMDAGRKRFTVIAVCKLDRFFRNLRLLLNHLHGLEQQGIKFVATQEGLDTSSPYGKFAIQIMGVIAEFERGRIGERVRDSRRYLISGGNWPGGRTTYGYRWLARERKWKVVPEEAETVRRIYNLYVNNKLGIESITAALNKDCQAIRNGSLWRFSTVRQILVHSGYKGRRPNGLQIPVIIDEVTWQKAQDKRETARSILATPKGWLLQGMCFCGLCGHVLKCQKKKAKQPAYYACRGRVDKKLRGTEDPCKLPYVRADKFEWLVWEKVKAVLNEPEKLLECVDQAMLNLEERKSQLIGETLDVDNKIEMFTAKAERLGIAYADGTISENVYKSKLKQFRKQIENLLKCRNNISPSELTELAVLEERITAIKEIMGKGKLMINEFGIFGMDGDRYAPAGFNAWRDTDGEMAIGAVSDQDTFRIEGTELTMKGIDAPLGFWECENPKEREETIKRNMRAILQFFNIKIFVFPERVEIRGAIPTQVLERKTERAHSTAPIIISPSLTEGRGKNLF